MENSDTVPGTKALSLIEAYRFGAEHGLQKEVDEIRNMEIEWDKKITSSLRRGYIIRLFQEKGIFEEFHQKHWPHYRTRAGQRTARWYLWNAKRYDDFLQGRETGLPTERADEEEEESGSEFAYETDLRDFLAQHLDVLGKGFTLYKDEQGSGIEYPVEGGRIDILARDGNGDFLVVELKVSQGRNKTVGQLLYYMGWVEANLGRGKKVRGAIIAKEISEDLKLACSRVDDVALYEYGLQVSLKKIT